MYSRKCARVRHYERAYIFAKKKKTKFAIHKIRAGFYASLRLSKSQIAIDA